MPSRRPARRRPRRSTAAAAPAKPAAIPALQSRPRPQQRPEFPDRMTRSRLSRSPARRLIPLAARKCRSVASRARYRKPCKPSGRPSCRRSPSRPWSRCPAASLRMGSNDDYSERPVHTVLIEPFLMARSAVTVQEWQACVAAKVHAPSRRRAGRTSRSPTRVGTMRSQYAALALRRDGQALPAADRGGMGIRRPGRDGHALFHGAMPWCPARQAAKAAASRSACRTRLRLEAYPPNSVRPVRHGRRRRRVGGRLLASATTGTRRASGTSAWNAPDCRERVLRGGSWVADAKDTCGRRAATIL